MSHNYANQFPIDNSSVGVNSFQLNLPILGLVQILLLQRVLDWKRIYSFFLGFQSSIRSLSINFDDRKDQSGIKDTDFRPSNEQEKRVVQSVSRVEVEIVLRSVGMSCNSEEAKLPESLDADDLFHLFDEQNPSLNEVKEAFDVFDRNRDGFIDAEELQKVLYGLGFKEGSDMKKCERMIAAFDENDDGRIDFEEFVKFMETSSY